MSSKKDKYVVVLMRWNPEAESYGLTAYAFSETLKIAREIAQYASDGIEDGDLLIPVDMAHVCDLENKAKKIYVRMNGATREAPPVKIVGTRYKSWFELWDVKDATHLIMLAIEYGVSRRLTAMVGCECVRQIGDARMYPYLSAAENWCQGNGTIDDAVLAKEELDKLSESDKSYKPAFYAAWSVMGQYYYAAQGAVMFSSEILVKKGKFSNESSAGEFLSNIVRKWIPLHVLLAAKIEQGDRRG